MIITKATPAHAADIAQLIMTAMTDDCCQFLNQSLLFHNPSPLPPGKDTPGFQLAPLSPTVQIFHRRPVLTNPPCSC